MISKRHFIQTTALGLGAGAVTGGHAQHAPRTARGPTLLTVSGLIGPGNRGALDPQLDQLMAKHQVKFSSAHAFDFAALTALPATSIEPTLEYDAKKHTLRGPLFADVMKACGVAFGPKLSFLVRALDGYAVAISGAEITERRFILATHLDDQPMALGGIGPLWSVFEPDRFPALMREDLKQRFRLCPWGTYHVEVSQG